MGISRGGGVVARLSSKFKKGQEPRGGFIMLAPFINPAATIGHVTQDTSMRSSGFGIKLPEWLLNSTIKSVNATSANYVEIDPKKPAVVTLKQPLLIIHGAKDRTIPYEESKKWAEEHAKIGNKVYYSTIPGTDHNELFSDSRCVEYTRAFLNKDFSKLQHLRLN